MSTVCCITARSPSRWRLLRARKSRSPRHVTLCTVIAHSMLLCVCVRACGHRHTHARKHSGAYWDEETRLQHQYTGEWLPHSAHLVRVLTGWTTDVGGPTALALKHCCQASQRANTMSRKLSLRGDYSKRALGVGVGWGGERGGMYRGGLSGLNVTVVSWTSTKVSP